MVYGYLETIVGPMFAGKTSELVKRVLWVKHQNKKVLVFNHASDTRYDTNHIVTHNQLKLPAFAVTTSADILGQFQKDKSEHVFVDEIHFFDNELIDVILEMLTDGCDVTVSGLDATFQGKAFSNASKLMAMADQVTKLKSYCSICGRDATKTFKKDLTADLWVVAGADVYEPRCNEHWDYTE